MCIFISLFFVVLSWGKRRGRQWFSRGNRNHIRCWLSDVTGGASSFFIFFGWGFPRVLSRVVELVKRQLTKLHTPRNTIKIFSFFFWGGGISSLRSRMPRSSLTLYSNCAGSGMPGECKVRRKKEGQFWNFEKWKDGPPFSTSRGNNNKKAVSTKHREREREEKNIK